MINLTAVIIPGTIEFTEKMVNFMTSQFKNCLFLNSVSDILKEAQANDIGEHTIYFFSDIETVPMLLMMIKTPYYLVAFTKDCDQMLDSEFINDYLYIREYPKFQAQLQRILRNLNLILERRSFSKEIDRLYQVGSFLGNERSVNKLIDIILEVSMNILGAEAGSFFYSIVDSRTNKWSSYKQPDQFKLLKFEIAKNRRMPVSIESMTFPILSSTIVGSAILMSKAIIIDDVHNIPNDAPYSYNAQVEKNALVTHVTL